MRSWRLAVILLCTQSATSLGQDRDYSLPIEVGVFQQQVHRSYTMEQGLPDNQIDQIDVTEKGIVIATTTRGTAIFNEDHWQPMQMIEPRSPSRPELNDQQLASLYQVSGPQVVIRCIAEHQDEFAVAADNGLYLGNGHDWHLALVQQGRVRWAPTDVRAVLYDSTGTLWFAAPQGVGYRRGANDWKLFTGADGLPYNDFTCMAAGPKGIWFGTTNGAILYDDGSWYFRQGQRWLLDNHVRDIAVDATGNVWIATLAGVSCIASQPMTLAKKAAFFEAELEKYHRRTQFGYLNPAELAVAGDKSTAVPVCTDNDGHHMGFYLAAVSLGYAATGNSKMKREAERAFRALAFLSEVTQGGSHPAPKGFIARAVIPTSDPDPNRKYDLAYDLRRHQRDALWKIIQPRWPVDKTGQWYWLCDGSVDELDGHYLGYGIYFDRACTSEAEKDKVREVVRRITDHLLDHDFHLVDWDGRPTRWGYFSPDDLNRNEAWVVERGLRSLAALNYLSVAHHITGDDKYRQAYQKLAWDHGYGMNGMTQPRDIVGPGTFGQGDDKMAFMNYYHLLRYETDPRLLSMYWHAIRRHWLMERYERCPWANFIYAACCLGKVRRDHWGETDLTPPKQNFADAIETLKRYPLDLMDWPMSNAHRTDMIPLIDHLGERSGPAGYRVDGYVFQVDERQSIRWGEDPYLLTYEGQGTRLGKGLHYLFAYYLGRCHGFITVRE